MLKLLKGLLLLALAVSALMFVNKNLAEELKHWIERFNVDPGRHVVQTMLAKVSGINAKKVELVSLVTFLYSALFLTEGIGLLLAKHWAEWLTIVVTASFLVPEIYELAKGFNGFKFILLLLNLAIVVYLLWRQKNRTRELGNNH